MLFGQHIKLAQCAVYTYYTLGTVNHINFKFKFFPPRTRRLLNKQTKKLGRQKHWYSKYFRTNEQYNNCWPFYVYRYGRYHKKNNCSLFKIIILLYENQNVFKNKIVIKLFRHKLLLTSNNTTYYTASFNDIFVIYCCIIYFLYISVPIIKNVPYI